MEGADGRDATRSLDRRIGRLAIPAMVALATDPLYDICDTAILGHVGTDELAGAALATRILALGQAVFIFLMFGTTAMVARASGRGERHRGVELAITAQWLGGALAALAVVLLGTSGTTLIDWFGGSGDVADHAWTYLRYSLLGIPAQLAVMSGIGYLRGTQDTLTPLKIAAVSVTANLVIESVAVFGFDYGVGASALSTVIARTGSAAVYLTIIGRRARRGAVSWRPDVPAVRQMLVIGNDLLIRTFALLGTITAASALAARQGAVALAAHSIAFQIWMFSAYVSDGIEVAGQALVGEAVGATNPGSARRATRRILTWSLRVGGVAAAIVVATRTVLPDVFSNDVAVLSLTASTLWWVAALQPVNALAFAADGVLVGAGQQRWMAIVMVASAVGFVAVAALTGADDLDELWAALTVFMGLRTGGALVRIRGTRWLEPSPGQR